MTKQQPWVALVLALLVACSASARQKTIATTFAATDVARATFVAFDEAHQKAIVAKATDRASAEKAFAEYYDTRQKVVDTFTVTYRAIAAAAVINTDQSLSAMLQAAVILSGALKALGVAVP
jgi:V8-like Glu-specific endopeptidase